MILPRKLFLVVTLSAGVLWAQAQKAAPRELPPSAYRLTAMTVTGSKRYTPEQIIAATGLRLGQTVSEDDFRIACEHLGDTGAFGDIAYNFKYSPEGTTLDLQIIDSNQLVPARFDNFVWLSDQELLRQLQERVPLFTGQLPVSGNLADQVSDALQGLLIEARINGRVDYLRSGPLEEAIDSVVFSVSGQNIRVANVEFVGAGPGELPLLHKAALPMRGVAYLRSTLRAQEDNDLLPVYLARGYLKARFGDAQPKVIEQTSEKTLVDVTFSVEPGRQYNLTEVHWTGNSVFRVNQLAAQIHLRPGEPPDAAQLAKDLAAVHKVYGSRGYLAAYVTATPEMDDEQSTVSYQLDVHEGDLYKMGELEIQGLDERNTAQVQDVWQLRGGETYDSSYPQRFRDELQRQFALENDWNLDIHESLNQDDKTVDVTVRFDPKPPR